MVATRKRKKWSARKTRALFPTFHAQTPFLLLRLPTVLPSAIRLSNSAQLTPCDLVTLELGPLGSLNSRFVNCLIEKYSSGVTSLVAL